MRRHRPRARCPTSYDLISGGAEILYIRTTDGGATFSPPLLVSTDDAFNSVGPAIAAGWGIALVWGDTNLATGESAILYSQSIDGGALFSAPRRLSTPGIGFKGCPSVALAGAATVYVAWLEGVDADRVVLSRSLDGGLTFSQPVVISSQPPQRSLCPRLVVDGAGTLSAFWREGAAFNTALLFTRSTDGGTSFSGPAVLSGPGTVSYGEEAVVTEAGTVFVSWATGDFNNFRCRLAALQADGTFSAPVEPPICGAMSARSPGALHVAWHEVPPGAQYSDVFHSRGDIRPAHLPRSFFAVPPCRIADTRGADGPALAANSRRTFLVGGRCGIPLDAVAVMANVTTTGQTDLGDLRLYGAGGPLPHTSTINFVAGRARANNATVPLGADAAITVQCHMPPGSTGFADLVLDVYGYYR